MKFETLHVLVVEDQPGVTQLLEEAFGEIEEVRYAQPWMRLCRRTFASTVDEALSLLRERTFDAILLDLAVPGNRESSAYGLIYDQHPLVPVVILAQPGDENLALSRIRQGAQDYLVTSEIDCAPLAKALRNAVERTRHFTALMQTREPAAPEEVLVS